VTSTAMLEAGSALELATRWVNATSSKDSLVLNTLYADDTILEFPFGEAGAVEWAEVRRVSGKDNVLAFWNNAFENIGEFGWNLEETFVSADGSTAFVEAAGDHIMKSGARYKNRYVLRFTVSQEKITHVREYNNPVNSAKAFGRGLG
jgi:ketosteroid isomerase-like protein